MGCYKSGNKIFEVHYEERVPGVKEGLLFSALNLLTNLIWVGVGFGVFVVGAVTCRMIGTSPWTGVVAVLGTVMMGLASAITWYFLLLLWWPLPPETEVSRGRAFLSGQDEAQQLANKKRRRV
jgi:hypothetical protein